MMKLYHGSTVEIKQIDLSKSLKGKDFGKGFYLSADLEQAKDMGQLRSLGTMDKPVVTVYDFDDTCLTDGSLKVKRFDDGYTREWAEFILANRNNYSDTPFHSYDIVIGPIADDRIGVQIRKLLDEEIDLDTFIERLKFMKGVTIQYFFGTENAIRYLNKVFVIRVGR